MGTELSFQIVLHKFLNNWVITSESLFGFSVVVFLSEEAKVGSKRKG